MRRSRLTNTSFKLANGVARVLAVGHRRGFFLFSFILCAVLVDALDALGIAFGIGLRPREEAERPHAA